MIDDVEDNYLEYLDDERGYAWDAWDLLPADVVRRHDGIVHATSDELARLDPATLDDLDRWAYARACESRADREGFTGAARLIAASDAEHLGVDYAEVFIALIEKLADDGTGDEAQLLLRTFRERWSDDTRAARLEVYIGARTGDAERSLAEAMTEVGDDGERLFEIAEDLLAAGAIEQARRVLGHATDVAREQDLRPLLLDIELLRGRTEDDATE
jgi:hypothetical protein